MQLHVASEECLGEQDVGTAGEGSVGETDVVLLHSFRDRSSNDLFVVRAERGVFVVADPVPAEVDDGGPGDRGEDVGIDPGRETNHAQLATRGCERAEVAGVRACGQLERGPGLLHLTE